MSHRESACDRSAAAALAASSASAPTGPTRVVPNSEIVERIDSSDEWIRERSGITERRIAGDGESVVDMSAFGRREGAGRRRPRPPTPSTWCSRDGHLPQQTPSAAAVVADRIGATNAAALDISAACAGFCYGIGLAADVGRLAAARSTSSSSASSGSRDMVDPYDRGTAFIFGDGAGAAVVGPVRGPAHRPGHLGR